MTIRNASTEDAEALVNIYAPYVVETAITFELEAPDAEDFRGRIAHITQKFPYIVAEENTAPATKDAASSADSKPRILGYAYAHTFRERHAYDHCVEMSIYIDRNCRRSGVGSALYTELEKRLRAMGIINLCASITTCDHPTPYIDDQSIRFHEKHGYTKVAHFHKCGHKFDDWFDMIWMEKILSN